MGSAGWPGAPSFQQYGVPQSYQGPPPWTLANFVLPANAPNFPSIGPFGLFNMLQLTIGLPAYGGSDVISLRFNGDNGANYVDRTQTAVAGGVVLTDTPTPNTTLIRLGLPTNQARVVTATIINILNRRKLVLINNQIGVADQTAPPILTNGTVGLWVGNPQITQIDIVTAGGLNIIAPASVLAQAWN